MATRTTYKSTTPGAVAGDDYMDNVADHIAVFYKGVPLKLTSVGGTANAITAVVDPVLDAGLIDGMSFWLEPVSTNTGAVTITIGSESAVNLKDTDGAALSAGELVSGTRYMLVFDGTEMMVLNKTPVTSGSLVNVQEFISTAGGTWTKPANASRVHVELWGAGGAGGKGGSGSGGGGGGYKEGWFDPGDLGSTESIGIGTGGAATAGTGGDGGNSTFGSLMTAYGGAGGTSSVGGGGGGMLGKGSGSTGGPPASGSTDADFGGGTGGSGGGNGGKSVYGGGGGGGGDLGDGGATVYGGGGGGGNTGQPGGTSEFGGDGGDGLETGGTAGAGAQPGGGGGGTNGGTAGAGGDGKCIVTTYL